MDAASTGGIEPRECPLRFQSIPSRHVLNTPIPSIFDCVASISCDFRDDSQSVTVFKCFDYA